MSSLALALSAGSIDASAQEWATKMFKTKSHDFGSVARGAEAEFSFEFENLYEEDLHVASVRSSCGCTTPTIAKRDLKTFEKSQIVAKYNTRLQTTALHPKAGRAITYQKCFEVQARQLRYVIEGKIPFYVPYQTK